jgi:hypothetical protein
LRFKKKEMIQIKKILSFAALIAYVGAIPAGRGLGPGEEVMDPKAPQTPPRPVTEEHPAPKPQAPESLGQLYDECGGFRGLDCDEGLICYMGTDNPQMADTTGTCRLVAGKDETCGGLGGSICAQGLTCQELPNKTCQVKKYRHKTKLRALKHKKTKKTLVGKVCESNKDCDRGLECIEIAHDGGICVTDSQETGAETTESNKKEAMQGAADEMSSDSGSTVSSETTKDAPKQSTGTVHECKCEKGWVCRNSTCYLLVGLGEDCDETTTCGKFSKCDNGKCVKKTFDDDPTTPVDILE